MLFVNFANVFVSNLLLCFIRGKVPSLIPIWLPGFSHTANPQEKKQARHLILPIQDSRSKSFDFLFLRLSQFQSISRPSNRNDLMTNKPKDIRIMKRTGHRLRRESDKQFGINKGGGSLNKLPSDLMGHLQTNFRNLEHYLGRAPFVQKRDEQVVFIPTGSTFDVCKANNEIINSSFGLILPKISFLSVDRKLFF